MYTMPLNWLRKMIKKNKRKTPSIEHVYDI